MSKLTILVFSFLGLISACVGQVELNKTCAAFKANLPTLPNFQINVFIGTWYELARYPQTTQAGQCNVAEYGPPNNNGVITVKNSQVVDRAWTSIQGTATANQNGEISVTFNINGMPKTSTLQVLTYNDRYAVLVSCTDEVSTGKSQVGSWKMSRTPSLEQQYENEMNNFINGIPDLDLGNYQTTNRICDVQLPGYIELDGPCENIRGIPDFNATDYLGEWREVARYPQPTQTGQCNRALYQASTNGAVSVLNRQVINEELSTISGTAIPASADGTGHLLVTFGENRVSNYYVIDTDYYNFALVYTCANTDNGKRRVGSWKLSRSGELSAQDNVRIYEAISDNADLFDGYYQRTSQELDACFYYPEFGPQESIELPGPCDQSIKGVADFNVNRFAGQWLDLARYWQPTQAGQCNRATYSLLPNGAVQVVNRQVVNEREATITGQAVLASNDGTGQLQVTFNIPGDIRIQDLYVLETDYEQYALLYSCTDLNNGTSRRVGSWKLSRTKTLSQQAIARIDEVINKTQGLHEKYYQETNQEEKCFYYPTTFGQQDSIVLTGACDNSIKGVANFNATRFAGQWLDLARYWQPTQAGQCNRATYSLLPTGAVQVVNRQVVNEREATITGQAVLASNDGTGQLRVTFNVGGEVRESDLYVLATDYDQYALLYSCTDLENGTSRQVGSWKLSRTQTLSPQANAVIDDVINNTQGLLQDYYQPTSQTFASCFYYPVLGDTQPQYIELEGPCDPTITGVTDFNATGFLGTWREVARYPQTTQAGQCNRAEYTSIAGGAVSVRNSQIINGTLSTIQGTAIFSNNDGSAQLDVSFSVNNELRRANYYVLATNYNSYALIYNCATVDNGNKRRVGSWKFSRTGTLTAEDNAAIDAVVNRTQGLSDEYYQPTDQSDETCFFYPNIAPNDNIIIPGQCDENISGIQAFDMSQFKGDWYQIQRYDPVTSSCVGTRLIPESDSIKIIAYEVVNGQLSIAEGTGRINSTDNTGKISLTMPVAGSEESTTTIVYILATDYDSYALAYSCSNVDGSWRQIRAWQLSRERNMSSAGAAAIAAQIQQRRELYQPYFKTIEQNADCPQPSSAFLFKSSIFVLLVCAVLQQLVL